MLRVAMATGVEIHIYYLLQKYNRQYFEQYHQVLDKLGDIKDGYNL